MLHQLLALLHHLRPTAHPLLHLVQQMLIHPSCQASSAFVARALRLERTGFTGRRCVIADMPPQFDRRKAERELSACWTLVGISTSVIGEVILAEEPELLVR